MDRTVDYVIIAAYLIGVAIFGAIKGGKQKSSHDYFPMNLNYLYVLLQIVFVVNLVINMLKRVNGCRKYLVL